MTLSTALLPPILASSTSASIATELPPALQAQSTALLQTLAAPELASSKTDLLSANIPKSTVDLQLLADLSLAILSRDAPTLPTSVTTEMLAPTISVTQPVENALTPLSSATHPILARLQSATQ